MNNTLSIYLRGFKEEDYKIINVWRNDPEIQRLVSTGFKYVSEAIEKEWVKKKMMDNTKDIYLAVCLKSTDEMVGYVSVNDINLLNRVARGGGIVLDKRYQDGIIRHEVGILIRNLVFDQLNINRYEGRCLETHTASRIIMEATGYKLEGIIRQAVYKDGRYHNLCIYSLLKEDYDMWTMTNMYSLRNFSKKVRELRKVYSV